MRRSLKPPKAVVIATVAAQFLVFDMAHAQQYKTDIPPAITIPDSVETRLGTLNFKDGFPDDATVQKVYDNLDFKHAVQAFLTAMPAASLSAQRKAIRSLRARQPDRHHFRKADGFAVDVPDRQHREHLRPGLARSEKARASSRVRRIRWAWSTISGFATSPISATPGRTRARAASSSSCRRTMQGRCPRATTSSNRPRTAISWGRAVSR